VLAGEASLDATWPLTSPGVPSIRMLHNHFIVFNKAELRDAPFADANNPNLTDGGQHSLFQAYMRDVYQAISSTVWTCASCAPARPACKIALTGYPQGLPSWEITGGVDSLKEVRFWKEYDTILKGFIDFYRTFFGQVSTRNAPLPRDIYFPELVERQAAVQQRSAEDRQDGARPLHQGCQVRQFDSLAAGIQATDLPQRRRQADRHHQPELDRQRHHRTARRGGQTRPRMPMPMAVPSRL
jgi:hypothetical protein